MPTTVIPAAEHDALAKVLYLADYSETPEMRDLAERAWDGSGPEHVVKDAWRHQADRALEWLEARLPQSIRDVVAERATHASRGYDIAHDEQHGLNGLVDVAFGYLSAGLVPATPEQMRKLLVKGTSVAVSAIDLLDRRAEVSS